MTAVRMRPSVLKRLRKALRERLPWSSSGLLNECIAAGLGFLSHEELREKIEDGPKFGLFDKDDFVDTYVALSDAPATIALLNIEEAITPLHGEDFIPSQPDSYDTRSVPDEWYVVMTAAVNTAIRRGLLDLEVDFRDPNALRVSTFSFELGGLQARCSFTESEDRNVHFSLMVENHAPEHDMPLLASAELERVEGLWLRTDNMTFEAEDAHIEEIKSVPLQRPLGFGPGLPYSAIRDRRNIQGVRHSLDEIAKEIEGDYNYGSSGSR
jgi:hypothetical protein